MATTTLNRPWLDQPDWTPQQSDPRELDASKMTFVFDQELDELTVLYYGAGIASRVVGGRAMAGILSNRRSDVLLSIPRRTTI